MRKLPTPMNLILSVVVVAAGLSALAAGGAPSSRAEAETPPRPHAATAESLIAAGRYIVEIAGCNDCHTPDYLARGGDVPETEWLTGSPTGFAGPWGVSYASNLRLSAAAMDEELFLLRARTGGLPPMPWPSLRAMSDGDLSAVYRYLVSLGPAGEPAPSVLPPGGPIPSPYIDMRHAAGGG